jgi:hypothetical protein
MRTSAASDHQRVDLLQIELSDDECRIDPRGPIRLVVANSGFRGVNVPRETALRGCTAIALKSERTAHGTSSVTTTSSTPGHLIVPLVTQPAASLGDGVFLPPLTMIRCCGPVLVNPRTHYAPWTRPMKEAPCRPRQKSYRQGLSSSSPKAQTPLDWYSPCR